MEVGYGMKQELRIYPRRDSLSEEEAREKASYCWTAYQLKQYRTRMSSWLTCLRQQVVSGRSYRCISDGKYGAARGGNQKQGCSLSVYRVTDLLRIRCRDQGIFEPVRKGTTLIPEPDSLSYLASPLILGTGSVMAQAVMTGCFRC